MRRLQFNFNFPMAVALLAAMLFLFSCKKDFPRQAAVLTESMDKPTATANGKVIDIGQTTINDHGFCWDNTGAPNVDGQKLALGKMGQTGNFSGKIPGLSPKTVYYLKAWVSSADGVEYGDLISFVTPDLPTVVLQVSGEITDTSARCSADVISDGGAPVIARGVCWNTAQTPDTNNYVFRDSVHATGAFNYTILGLSAGTKYYTRAFAKNIYGIRYSDETSFTTAQSAMIPVVTTVEISNITINSVTSGGNVTSDGGASVTVRGVCWNTTPYPTIDQNKTTDGSETGLFVSSVTGLIANTTYYLRSYATNSIGTGYGEEKSFTTLPNPIIPTVITTSVTNITTTSATSGGTVLADGGNGVTARGVCWSAAPNPTTSNTHTVDGVSLGTFTSNIISLVSGTKYFVRAYASNSVGTAYGNEVSFTAGQNVTAPTVTTTEVINIAQTTATCGGNVTADGGATVTARGVCWSTSINPTTANSKTSDGSGTGGYLSSMTGLTANTTYHVRAYATNSAGTSYGNERIFTTLTEVTIPAVTTAPVTNITNNSSTSGGTVTNDGGASVTSRGVCWSTANNPTIADPKTNNGTGTGSFISQISGLLPNTFYRVRAYATNSAGTAYGNQQTFSTLQNPTLPIVSTTPATNITDTTATSGGTVNSDGGSAVTVRGVCYSVSPNPTLAGSHTTNGSGVGTFASNLTALTPNTLYYVKAYATNGVGTSYGNEITFTTLTSGTLASVNTTVASNITQTTATSGGNVTSEGGSSVTARGVCWSIAANPTTSNSHTTDGSGTGSFVSNLTGLTPGTLYYYRAYATNSVGTAYGIEVMLTTQSSVVTPTVTTTAVTGITQITATSGGNVTASGGATVTARGVCWGTSSSPTISNSHTIDGSGTGVFVSSLTSLTPNTLYYVRAYATNSVGTAYGNEVTFTTLPNPVLPTVTTTTVTNITQTTATSGGNVTSDGGATVTARGVCWSTSSNPTTTNSHTTDGSGTGVFVSSLSGLTANTLYYVRAYATNSVGTTYGNEVNFTTISFSIGQSFGGGIIFYIDGTGQHGLISATTDQSTGAAWGCYGTSIPGTSTAIGTGQANTTIIVNWCMETGIAARICDNLVLNGYSDWFLPSKDELNEMYLHKAVIGGFVDSNYWSSSEATDYIAWYQGFGSGGGNGYKFNNYAVRAVRAF